VTAQPVEPPPPPGPVDRPGSVSSEAEAWFRRTGHCHDCGQPGGYCQCGRPCACSALHEHGSGRLPGALDQFAEVSPVAVGDDQGELFA
jgi:hypothetical protein